MLWEAIASNYPRAERLQGLRPVGFLAVMLCISATWRQGKVQDDCQQPFISEWHISDTSTVVSQLQPSDDLERGACSANSPRLEGEKAEKVWPLANRLPQVWLVRLMCQFVWAWMMWRLRWVTECKTPPCCIGQEFLRERTQSKLIRVCVLFVCIGYVWEAWVQRLEVRGQPCRVDSLLSPLDELWELNWGHQAGLRPACASPCWDISIYLTEGTGKLAQLISPGCAAG